MTEIEIDLDLLLECLKCQLDSPAGLKQALLTIASMCSGNDAAQNHFRECRGLDYVLNLVSATKFTEVKEAGLYMLGNAVERNVYSQKHLTTRRVFEFLSECLSSSESSARLKQTACFSILSIVANNSLGQTMVRKTECLPHLLKLFKSCLPTDHSGKDLSSTDWLDKVEDGNKDLWTSVTSAICVCVNNPQNEENQRLCATILPQAFFYLRDTKDSSVIRSIASLVGLMVASNMNNKDRIYKCGGLDVLVGCLGRMMHNLHQNYQDLGVAVALSSTLDNVISDHAQNIEKCGELGLVALLIKLLQLPGLESQVKIQVVLTLGHCTDSSACNQVRLVEQGGLAVLIQALTNASDEELAKSIKYVLQTCVSVEPSAVLGESASQKQKMKPVVSGAKRELERIRRFQGVQTRSSKKTLPIQDTVSGEDIREKLFELERKLEASMEISEENMKHIVAQGSVPYSPQRPFRNLEVERLQQELNQERSLRKHLEMEAKRVKQALEDQAKKEQFARTRAEALARELDRQQSEQEQEDAKLKQQVEESRKEHARLLDIQQQKERELREIQEQLKQLEDDTHLELEKFTSREQYLGEGSVSDHETHGIASSEMTNLSRGNKDKCSQTSGKDIHVITHTIHKACSACSSSNDWNTKCIEKSSDCNCCHNSTPTKTKTHAVAVQTPECLSTNGQESISVVERIDHGNEGDINNCSPSITDTGTTNSDSRTDTINLTGHEIIDSTCKSSNCDFVEKESVTLKCSSNNRSDTGTPNNEVQVFVKPIAPAKRSVKTSYPGSAPPQLSIMKSGSFKRQLFRERDNGNSHMGGKVRNPSTCIKDSPRPGKSFQKESSWFKNNRPVQNMPSSPCSSIQSEFDCQLMREASRSGIDRSISTSLFYSKPHGGGDTGLSPWDENLLNSIETPTQKGDCRSSCKQLTVPEISVNLIRPKVPTRKKTEYLYAEQRTAGWISKNQARLQQEAGNDDLLPYEGSESEAGNSQTVTLT